MRAQLRMNEFYSAGLERVQYISQVPSGSTMTYAAATVFLMGKPLLHGPLVVFLPI